MPIKTNPPKFPQMRLYKSSIQVKMDVFGNQRCNICLTKEGPYGKAKLIQTKCDALSCFTDYDILHKVIENTSPYARMYMVPKGRDPSTWKWVDETEMKAVIGVLYLLQVDRSLHKSLRSLWSSGQYSKLHSALIGLNRSYHFWDLMTVTHVRWEKSMTNLLHLDHSEMPSMKIAGKTITLVRLWQLMSNSSHSEDIAASGSRCPPKNWQIKHETAWNQKSNVWCCFGKHFQWFAIHWLQRWSGRDCGKEIGRANSELWSKCHNW